jgi:hypothetical protein
MKASAKNEGRDPEGLWMPMVRSAMLEQAILERRIRLKRNPVTDLGDDVAQSRTKTNGTIGGSPSSGRSTRSTLPLRCAWRLEPRTRRSRPQFEMMII